MMPNKFEQVLINMIHNAVQAMPNRGSLRISLEASGRNGANWNPGYWLRDTS